MARLPRLSLLPGSALGSMEIANVNVTTARSVYSSRLTQVQDGVNLFGDDFDEVLASVNAADPSSSMSYSAAWASNTGSSACHCSEYYEEADYADEPGYYCLTYGQGPEPNVRRTYHCAAGGVVARLWP
ncbi:hypothetical protein PG993_011937 [Apiospora rasikravindrae]|uniref:Uncharacterized protein n=1 Tax=Apiospora rasikravindrae TaxID=990691 RepID=A0ABR1S2N9_9PEZI